MSARPVAIVPARGGSKRIPRKNIQPFLGVPLLARTLETLLTSQLFSRVVVSSDDDEIAAIATEAGAEVPFRRPRELSDDHTPTGPVIAHAIRSLEGTNVTDANDLFCCVYPASVLVRHEDLAGSRDAMLGLMMERRVDYTVAATTFGAPIRRALRRLADGSCEMLWPEHALTRSQDLEETFHDAGQFYWGTRAAWLEGRPILSTGSVLYPLPRWRVVDIDTPEDWQRAELLFETFHERTRG